MIGNWDGRLLEGVKNHLTMLKNRSRERHVLRTLMVKENVVSFKYFIFYCKILGIFAYVGGF